MTGQRFILDLLNHARRIQPIFAMVLAVMAYPLLRLSPRNTIPIYDWILAALGLDVCLYAVVNHEDVTYRSGSLNNVDITIGALGLAVLAVLFTAHSACRFSSFNLFSSPIYFLVHESRCLKPSAERACRSASLSGTTGFRTKASVVFRLIFPQQ